MTLKSWVGGNDRNLGGTCLAPAPAMAKPRNAKKGDSAPGDTTAANSDRDRIAMRAYELYLERGRGDGAAMDDWLAAERELTQPDDDRSSES